MKDERRGGSSSAVPLSHPRGGEVRGTLALGLYLCRGSAQWDGDPW